MRLYHHKHFLPLARVQAYLGCQRRLTTKCFTCIGDAEVAITPSMQMLKAEDMFMQLCFWQRSGIGRNVVRTILIGVMRTFILLQMKREELGACSRQLHTRKYLEMT